MKNKKGLMMLLLRAVESNSFKKVWFVINVEMFS